MRTFFLCILFSVIALTSNAQWTSLSAGATVDLNDCFFLNRDTGFIVGGYGKILKTTDGGLNWGQYVISGQPWLHAVFFTDDLTGYAVGGGSVGGGCYKTTDGGASWNEQTTNMTTTALFSVFFTDASTGYIAGGNGNIIKTINGGTNWILQQNGSAGELHGVSFADSNHGWAVGNYVIRHTSNGGASWTTQQNSSCIFHSCVALDTSTCYVSGSGGIILKTNNGGQNWDTVATGTLSDITKIFFVDANTCYAVGGQGTILQSSDAGAHWNVQSSGLPFGILFSVYFPTPLNGYIVGGSGIFLKTDNGGITTGIRESLLKTNDVKVWPNPADDLVDITVSESIADIQYTITDLMGRTVDAGSITQPSIQLNLSAMNNGLYLLKLMSQQHVLSCKPLIIQHN